VQNVAGPLAAVKTNTVLAIALKGPEPRQQKMHGEGFVNTVAKSLLCDPQAGRQTVALTLPAGFAQGSATACGGALKKSPNAKLVHVVMYFSSVVLFAA